MSGIKKNDQFELTITDFSDEGLGIGKTEGFTWFVKDTVIGDRVLAKALKIKKNYGFARLVRVLSPSSYRVEPPCPIAVPCGGCSLQQLDYKAQLKFKEDKVYNDLLRIGGLTVSRDIMEPIIGMEHPYRYRSKAAYPIGKSRDGRLISGFYAGRTHSIIECDDCLIGAEENRPILKTILSFMERYHISSYNEEHHKGTVRHVLIRKGYISGDIMVCIVINADELSLRDPGLKEELLKELLHTEPRIRSFSLCINKARTNVIMGEKLINIYGPGYIEDVVGGIRFRISPFSFFQVNPVNMLRLYETVIDYAGLTGRELVWDLYCGVGTISLFMARHAAHVYGVEIVPEAVENARENALINNMANAEFFTGKAEEVLPEWYRRTGMKADVIVTDPPRKGCDEKCLRTILDMQPLRIVYVSCNPSTLARDIRYLTEGGYSLQRIRPCDMFPQTLGIETVCLLGKRKPDTTVRIGIDMEDYYRLTGEK